MRLTNEVCTTVSGLSEGIFWDFKNACVSKELLALTGSMKALSPKSFLHSACREPSVPMPHQLLGLTAGTPVTYRAGDQPNNALSLNVFNPGEIASTAGTSGVVYGINGSVNYDPLSRVNTFAHVNHKKGQTRLGVLLCINGTGILNSWIKRNIAPEDTLYSSRTCWHRK